MRVLCIEQNKKIFSDLFISHNFLIKSYKLVGKSNFVSAESFKLPRPSKRNLRGGPRLRLVMITQT